MSSPFSKCSSCRAMFEKEADLTHHLMNSPGCRTRTVDPHAFTVESSVTFERLTDSATVPDTYLTTSRRSPSGSSRLSAVPEDSLLREMCSVMKKPLRKEAPTRSGLETSILSAIAEGDESLADAYMALSVDGVTGSRKLTKEIVAEVANKAKINVRSISKMISRAQKVSLCFLLDTTGSMHSYIAGVKLQIVEILRQVEKSGCMIAGIAFVGYKDWCDGKLF